eukprot:12104-Heterococcus_DN1.PRE.2
MNGTPVLPAQHSINSAIKSHLSAQCANYIHRALWLPPALALSAQQRVSATAVCSQAVDGTLWIVEVESYLSSHAVLSFVAIAARPCGTTDDDFTVTVCLVLSSVQQWVHAGADWN